MLTMPEPRPVALVGDLLATQAKAHGAAALLVDASVRDIEELAELGLPIWARWVRVRGAAKEAPGAIGEPVIGRRRRDPPGRRRSCSTPTASRWSSSERLEEVLEASRAAGRERAGQAREAPQGGALSYDLDGLRERVEAAR